MLLRGEAVKTNGPHWKGWEYPTVCFATDWLCEEIKWMISHQASERQELVYFRIVVVFQMWQHTNPRLEMEMSGYTYYQTMNQRPPDSLDL